MWIRRKEFEALQKEVKELQSVVRHYSHQMDYRLRGVAVSNPEHDYAVIGLWPGGVNPPYDPWKYISFENAIQAIATHIGMQFIAKPGIPEKIVLEPIPKKAK